MGQKFLTYDAYYVITCKNKKNQLQKQELKGVSVTLYLPKRGLATEIHSERLEIKELFSMASCSS